MGKLHNGLDPWEPAELEKIHRASLDVLERVGVWAESDDVLDILESSATRIDRDKKVVRFPVEMVEMRMRGIGAEFLDCETTLLHLREVHYASPLFYRKRRSEWLREGANDVLVRAHERVESLLSRDTPAFLTADQLAATDEIIAEA
jgi:trimethylamine:corrinoid methyltransferase-like protein